MRFLPPGLFIFLLLGASVDDFLIMMVMTFDDVSVRVKHTSKPLVFTQKSNQLQLFWLFTPNG